MVGIERAPACFRWLIALVAAMGVVFASCAPAGQAGLALPQPDGRTATPFAETNSGPLAFVFVSTDCPISNRYAPEIQRLQKLFEPRVTFWLVYPNRGESDDAVQKHLREFGHTAQALRDPERKLVKLARVKVTPEVAIFSAKGTLAYHGRIDNRHADFGKERPAPITRDFETALAAVLSGKSPEIAATPAVGCPIQ